MAVLIFLIIMLLIALVIAVVGAPLRARARAEALPGGEAGRGAGEVPGDRRPEELAELDAEREAKYQEIRDAELDYRTGKLSQGDFESIDASLRAEAIEILDRLQLLEGAGSAAAERAGGRGETDPDAAEPRGEGRDGAGAGDPIS